MSPCIGIAASSLGVEQGNRLESQYLAPVLRKLDGALYEGVLTSGENARECLTRVVLAATGGTEDTIISLAKKTKLLYLLYIEEYNSLPAVIEAVGYLKNNGKDVSVAKLEGTQQIQELLEKLGRIEKTYEKIRVARLGLIGGISPWLVYSKVEPETLHKRLGAGLVEVPLEGLVKTYNSVSEVEVPREIIENALEVKIPVSEIQKAYRLYLAIKQVIAEKSLDGLTIKCFDIIKELDTTACLALSLLNTMGFPAACEGDVPLLVSMVLGEWSTGQPVFMANPAIISGDSVLFAHCTAPLISSYSLMTHFESGRGVGIMVKFPVGEKVTVYRVNPNLDTLRIFTGTILESPWSNRHCRTQVKVKLSKPRVILDRSFGNHYALVLGDHTEEISGIARLLGLNLETY